MAGAIILLVGIEAGSNFAHVKDLIDYLWEEPDPPELLDPENVTELPKPKAYRFDPKRPRAFGPGGDPLPPKECK